MPGTVCSVALCKSNSSVAKKKGELIAFFSFPKDEGLRRKWIKKCYRKDKFKPDNKRICNKHFRIDDFEDLVAAKLKNTIPRKLKRTAIPSLYLLPEDYDNDHEDERTVSDEEKQVKARKELVEQILAEQQQRDFTVDEATQTDKEGEYSILQNKYDQLVKKHKYLKDVLEKYKLNFEILTIKKTSLQNKVNNFNKSFKNKIKSAFSDVFTRNQLNVIFRNKDNNRWSDDEMRKAFVLKSINKRAYIYMLQLKYPFPSYSSLKRWEAINVSQDEPDVINEESDSNEETVSEC